MTYRELLEKILEPYGFYPKLSFDGDYDILVPIDESIPGKLSHEMRSHGFEVYKSFSTYPDFFREWHVHSPARATWSKAGKGWDVEVSNE